MITVYATNKDGKGVALKIGEVEKIEDFEINVGYFASDVVITFEQQINP